MTEAKTVAEWHAAFREASAKAETVDELRALLAERDAYILDLRRTVRRLAWDAHRIGPPPWQWGADDEA